MSTVRATPPWGCDSNAGFPEGFHNTRSKIRWNRELSRAGKSVSRGDHINPLPRCRLRSFQPSTESCPPGNASWSMMRRSLPGSSAVHKLSTARAMEILTETMARKSHKIVRTIIGWRDLLSDELSDEEKAGNR